MTSLRQEILEKGRIAHFHVSVDNEERDAFGHMYMAIQIPERLLKQRPDVAAEIIRREGLTCAQVEMRLKNTQSLKVNWFRTDIAGLVRDA